MGKYWCCSFVSLEMFILMDVLYTGIMQRRKALWSLTNITFEMANRHFHKYTSYLQIKLKIKKYILKLYLLDCIYIY
jgi:hypothetical protein